MLKNVSFFFTSLLPLSWLYLAPYWVSQANKPMVAIVGVALLVFVFDKEILQKIKSLDFSLWNVWLCCLSIFSLWSYYYLDSGSQALRASMISAVFVFIYDRRLIGFKQLQWFFILSILSSFVLTFAYLYVFKISDRGEFPVNAIIFAGIAGFIGICLLCLLFVDFEGKKNKWIVGFFFLSLTATFASGSRGPLLAQLLTASVLLINYCISAKVNLSKRHLLLGLLSVGVIIFANWSFIMQRIVYSQLEIQQILSNDFDSSIGIRLQLWKLGIETFKEHVFFGVGQFTPENIAPFNLTSIAQVFALNSHLHNNFINAMATQGLLGLSVLLITLFLPVYCCLKTQVSCKLILFPVFFWFITCVFDAPFVNGDTNLIYCITIGLLLCAANYHQAFAHD